MARFADVQAQVALTRDFLLAQTEATRQQWRAEGLPLPEPQPSEAVAEPRCGAGECPVVDINFFEAVAFANRFSEQRKLEPCYVLRGCKGELGRGLSCQSVESRVERILDCKGYRLPTEAEWEYAARAGVTAAFYAGPISRQNDAGCHPDKQLDDIGWYCHNSENVAHPARGKKANAWGLYDMSGNVFEWCNDLKTVKGYGSGPFVDPVWPLGQSPLLDASAEFPERIARGGSFSSSAFSATSSWRSGFPDATRAANVGLRLARSLPSQGATRD